MKNIVLIGGGGHCKSVIDVIEQEKKYKISGIVDKQEFLGTNILGHEVIGNDLDLESLVKKFKYAIITVGYIKSANLRYQVADDLTGFGAVSGVSGSTSLSIHKISCKMV